MANIPRCVAQQVLTTTASTLYTVPVGKMCTLKEIIMVNTADAPVTVTIHIVPKGETPSVKTHVFKQDAYIGRETKITGLSTFINSEAYVTALASVDSVVSIYMSGAEKDLE